MRPRVGIVPVVPDLPVLPMKAHPRALIANRGITHRGGPAYAVHAVLVLTLIKQNQQPVKPVLQESMPKIRDQQPAIRTHTARPAMGQR